MSKPLTMSQRKRLAILAAARQEFQENGFQNTNMDRIATRAEVSKRTLYNHFNSKEALFALIAEQLLEQVRQAVDISFDAGQLEQQLRFIAQQGLQLFADQDFIDSSRMLIAEGIRAPQMAKELMAQMAETESGLVRWMQQAAAQALTIDDPAFAAEQFMALLKAFAFWPQVIKGQPFPDQSQQQRIVDSTVAMFLSHYQTRG